MSGCEVPGTQLFFFFTLNINIIMKDLKLNVLLAKTDTLAVSFKGMLKDFAKFFSGSQGAFIGYRKTYEVKDGMVDDPTKRGTIIIQTTVKEKLDWFLENSADYIDALFSQEKTNSSGIATADLVVDGESWGTFTSLELLRLKSVVENNDLATMINSIPVRSDSKQWSKTSSDLYEGREGIYELPLLEGTLKTTEKEQYIIQDPNLTGKEDIKGYVPQVATRTTSVDLGDYTVQEFSGESSQRERAGMLKRRANLLVAVTVALKQCNEVDVVNSTLTANKVFGYLFKG